MWTVVLCLWALSISYVAWGLIVEWDIAVEASKAAAAADEGNCIEGRTIIDEGLLGKVILYGCVVLLFATAPLQMAWGVCGMVSRAAAASRRWASAKLPCRHRLGVRCGRCGKARYRVDAPAGVVSDPQYPDWD